MPVVLRNEPGVLSRFIGICIYGARDQEKYRIVGKGREQDAAGVLVIEVSLVGVL